MLFTTDLKCFVQRAMKSIKKPEVLGYAIRALYEFKSENLRT